MHLWNVPLLFAPKCSKNQKKTIFFNTKRKWTKEEKKNTKKWDQKKGKKENFKEDDAKEDLNSYPKRPY